MKNPMRTAGFFMTVLFLFSACATVGLNSGDTAALKKSVKRVWDAKLNGDWEVVYDISVKEYKSKVKKDDFLKSPKIKIKDYTIKEVNILEPGQKAVSVVGYEFTEAGFEFQVSQYKEEWLWEDNAWHLNLMRTLTTPAPMGGKVR